MQRGEDPVEDKKREDRERHVNGFEACVGEYIEKYAKVQQRTWEETKRILDRPAIPEWGAAR